MASGLLAYSGLVTKTKAMHGRLLTRQELTRLTEYEGVEDLISFLREHGSYAKIFASHDEVAHRGQVEAVIGDSLYQDYSRIYCFANGVQRKALAILFMRYEIDELKYCLERVIQDGNTAKRKYWNPFFAEHAAFDVTAAMSAGSITELLQALSDTSYARLISRLYEESGGDYAYCATQLDIYYYRTVWKIKDKIPDGRTREICTELLGTEIDWQNIMWIYRSKRFYGRSAADIAANVIPVSFRLRKEKLRELIEVEQLEEFVHLVGQTAYFTEKEAVVKLGDEITYRLIMDRTYQKICRKYPMSIAPVFKYFYDKENEIDILTTILEGVRYRIPSKEIQELVLVTA